MGGGAVLKIIHAKRDDPYRINEYYDLFLDGKPIGYWYVSNVLQTRYGEILGNDYLTSLLAGRTFIAIGSLYTTVLRLVDLLNLAGIDCEWEAK